MNKPVPDPGVPACSCCGRRISRTTVGA